MTNELNSLISENKRLRGELSVVMEVPKKPSKQEVYAAITRMYYREPMDRNA